MITERMQQLAGMNISEAYLSDAPPSTQALMKRHGWTFDRSNNEWYLDSADGRYAYEARFYTDGGVMVRIENINTGFTREEPFMNNKAFERWVKKTK